MTKSPPLQGRPPRPGSVTFAVLLQWLLAVALAVSGIVNTVYGAEAKETYEAELAERGLAVSDLPAGGLGIGPAMFGLAVIAIALSLANAAGKASARVLTWMFQGLLLICVGSVLTGRLFFARQLQSAFDDSGEPEIANLDSGPIVEAALGAYPPWSLAVDWAVLVMATLGSVLATVLLALPSARSYFPEEGNVPRHASPSGPSVGGGC